TLIKMDFKALPPHTPPTGAVQSTHLHCRYAFLCFRVALLRYSARGGELAPVAQSTRRRTGLTDRARIQTLPVALAGRVLHCDVCVYTFLPISKQLWMLSVSVN